jgi:hypothetical protein
MTNTTPAIIVPEAQIKAIVKEAVQQTFLNLGLDVSDPEGMVDFQRDMHYLRANRLRKENVETKALSHIVTMVLSGIAAAIIMFFVDDRLGS